MEYDKINTMSIEERTEKYTTRRTAELRGVRQLFLLDERTEKYIARRMAQLRGAEKFQEPIREDPYIRRRIAYLRADGQ
jgi:hypothetical protein